MGQCSGKVLISYKSRHLTPFSTSHTVISWQQGLLETVAVGLIVP